MSPPLSSDVIDLEDDEQSAERRGAVPPERFNRRKNIQRTRKRAARGRANEMAKRGMHQRRNKRVAW